MLLRQSDQDAIRKLLAQLPGPVTLTLRTIREGECRSCPTTEQLLQEVAELSPNVRVEIEEAEAPEEPAPVITLTGAAAGRVRFLGLPEGHEFASLLDAMRRVAGEPLTLGDATRDALAGLRRPAHVRVFATPN